MTRDRDGAAFGVRGKTVEARHDPTAVAVTFLTRNMNMFILREEAMRELPDDPRRLLGWAFVWIGFAAADAAAFGLLAALGGLA